jgi:actin-related protein
MQWKCSNALACVTGLVVDSVDRTIWYTSIFEGYSLPHALIKLYDTGKDITKHLIQLLKSRECPFTCLFNKTVMDDLKTKMCFVTLHSEKDGKARAGTDIILSLRWRLCPLPKFPFACD